jgi:hypothetical protein
VRNAAGQWIGLGLGDVDPEVRLVRNFLRKKFSYGADLADTDVYGTELRDVVSLAQRNYGMEPTGIWTYALKVRCGYYKPAPPVKPVIFTVEGHMSSMWIGPCAQTGWQMEQEGLARWQPVGYNNTALPFDNASGVRELDRLFSDTTAFPLGTPWAMCIFSQGGIVGSQFFIRHVKPETGKHHNRLKDLRGVLAFGNPYREVGVVSEWITDPPATTEGGISDERMSETPSWWKEVARRGDLYTCNDPATKWGKDCTAIYKAVQNEWTDAGAIIPKLIEIGVNPSTELVSVAVAIIHGVRFLADMSPHGTYEMDPCISFMRECLRADQQL